MLNNLLVLEYLQMRAALLQIGDTHELRPATGTPAAASYVACVQLLPPSTAAVRQYALIAARDHSNLTARVLHASLWAGAKLADKLVMPAIAATGPVGAGAVAAVSIVDKFREYFELFPAPSEVVISRLAANPQHAAPLAVLQWFMQTAKRLRESVAPFVTAHPECAIERAPPQPEAPTRTWYQWITGQPMVAAPAAVEPPPPPAYCKALVSLVALLDRASLDNALLLRVAIAAGSEQGDNMRAALQALSGLASAMPDYEVTVVRPRRLAQQRRAQGAGDCARYGMNKKGECRRGPVS